MILECVNANILLQTELIAVWELHAQRFEPFDLNLHESQESFPPWNFHDQPTSMTFLPLLVALVQRMQCRHDGSTS